MSSPPLRSISEERPVRLRPSKPYDRSNHKDTKIKVKSEPLNSRPKGLKKGLNRHWDEHGDLEITTSDGKVVRVDSTRLGLMSTMVQLATPVPCPPPAPAPAPPAQPEAALEPSPPRSSPTIIAPPPAEPRKLTITLTHPSPVLSAFLSILSSPSTPLPSLTHALPLLALAQEFYATPYITPTLIVSALAHIPTAPWHALLLACRVQDRGLVNAVFTYLYDINAPALADDDPRMIEFLTVQVYCAVKGAWKEAYEKQGKRANSWQGVGRCFVIPGM